MVWEIRGKGLNFSLYVVNSNRKIDNYHSALIVLEGISQGVVGVRIAAA